jgi:hypothetical protein
VLSCCSDLLSSDAKVCRSGAVMRTDMGLLVKIHGND